jgi:hypothetical protein
MSKKFRNIQKNINSRYSLEDLFIKVLQGFDKPCINIEQLNAEFKETF